MKVLITGTGGMLAREVRKKFAFDDSGAANTLLLTDLVADGRLGRKALDITDGNAVMEFITEERPDIIINCAAYTNVDASEENAELAEEINADGPKNLAEAASKNNAVLVHISTDYVFGGSKPIDEEYSEDDKKEPKSVYGVTKLRGEEEIVKYCDKYYIFRTAWLYGIHGKNFVETMLKVADGRTEVNVVDDQHGSPTYAKDLADVIWQAVYKQIPFGIYNATNLGFTTWADFTREIYKECNVDCKVNGISSAEYEKSVGKTVAERPKNSKMSKEKLIQAGIMIPDWRDGLKRYLVERSTNEK